MSVCVVSGGGAPGSRCPSYLIKPNLLTVGAKSLSRVSGTQRSLFPESETRDCCMAAVPGVLERDLKCSTRTHLEPWAPIWEGLSGLRPSGSVGCDHHPQAGPGNSTLGMGVAVPFLTSTVSLSWGPGPRSPPRSSFTRPEPSLSSVPSQGLQLQLQPGV